MLFAATASQLVGCLVTDEITFDGQPDLPPVIVDAPGAKAEIGSIVWLDKQAASMWSFPVQIREQNVDQRLDAHFRVVHQGNASPDFESVPVLPQAGAVLRDLTLVIKAESLRPGECHHLELAVSAAFFNGVKPVFFDAVPPGREDEVAYASWWLWEGPGDTLATEPDKARLAETCRAVESFLTPTQLSEAPSP